ncbi:pyrroline-5-carboxylate reductase [Phycomyces nitens]|nr:pyrroline-5-carboxylate reductase [Phycomyces nitens]
MAEAILGGLFASGHPGDRLRYSEPFEERRKYMQGKYPEITSETDNNKAIDGADVIIFAVKPQVMRAVVDNLSSALRKNSSSLIISIAAGITTADIVRWMNMSEPMSLVRCMPNTPALLGEGAVGLYANDRVNSSQRTTAESILSAVSKQVSWVDSEPLIDSVTGLSGSGPAYFFLVMEAMQNAGIAMGLSSEDAKALTVQTCLGAARMAQESEDDLATLRRKVTSPNGTTEAAVKVLEANNLRGIIKDCVFAAEHRSRELAAEMGKD